MFKKSYLQGTYANWGSHSDVQLSKRRKIDLKKSIVEKPREEQTHNHGNGEASGTVPVCGKLGERKSQRVKEKPDVDYTSLENQLK